MKARHPRGTLPAQALCVLAMFASPPGARAGEPPAPVPMVILHEPGMPVRGAATPAPALARILASVGVRSRLVSARELADPAVLDPGTISLVVLPMGQSFPVAARESLERFLRGGGDLIQMGGYAFENLLWEHRGQWCTLDQLRKLDPTEAAARAPLFRPMNTARGDPKNELGLAQEQIGLFDACFPLKRACRMSTASGQAIVRARVDVRRPLLGWAATGIVGDYANNGIDFLKAKIATNARWVPLLETYDRYDRPRGAAAGLLLNARGFYAGSNWACFGIENCDLFDDPTGPCARALQDVARFLLRGVYLQEVTLEKRYLREGEPIQVRALVRNAGTRAHPLRLRFAAGPARTRLGAAPVEVDLTAAPGVAQPVCVELARPANAGWLGQVTVALLADGEPIDEIVTGYVVDRPDLIRAAPDLRFVGNHFTRAGRPVFLCGTDETAYVYLTPHENPLTWSRDLLAARDVGVTLYENLQFSRPAYRMRDGDWADFRAMAQLTQRYNMVFMPGMLIVHNVAAGDDVEIARQSRQCEGYGRLLSDVPGCLYYLNGDIVCRPDPRDPTARRLWNDWVRARHGSTDGLRRAWGDAGAAAELGTLGLPPKMSGRWADPVAIDWVRFLQGLTERWHETHLVALRRWDTRHPTTSEFNQVSHSGINHRVGIGRHDVANTNLFLPVEAIPGALRWNDLRTRGKGLSVGEFGMRAHPAWTGEGGPGGGYATPRTDRQQSRLSTFVFLYGMGLGAAKIQNWCLRDGQHRSVHAFGLFHVQPMIPKDVAFIHRNLSMFWRHFTPRYAPPALGVCIPLNLGQGNQMRLENDVACRAFATLSELHHDFAVFDDAHLDTLDATTRTLVYPAPFAVCDTAYRRLLDWVRAGGILLVTGDFSFDENRQCTRGDRLRELAGVTLISRNYADVARASGVAVRASFTLPNLAPMTLRPCLRLEPAGAEILGTGPAGEPVLTRHRVGRGTVWYVVDPLELSPDPADAGARRRLYAAALRDAPVRPLAIAPAEPWLHVLVQPTARGAVHVVANMREAKGDSSVRVALDTAAGRVTLGVRDGWPAMAAATGDGCLVAAFADGTVDAGESIALDGPGLKGILSLDGLDIRASRALLIAPWEPGAVFLPGAADRVACIGEFQEGRWVHFEQVPLPGPVSRLALDGDRATCMILVCAADAVPRWQDRLTGAMLHPERIEGY